MRQLFWDRFDCALDCIAGHGCQALINCMLLTAVPQHAHARLWVVKVWLQQAHHGIPVTETIASGLCCAIPYL